MIDFSPKPFTYDDYDTDNEGFCKTFFNVMLTRDIGSYRKGERFPAIVIDYEKGRMEFLNQEGQVLDQFDLVLAVKS